MKKLGYLLASGLLVAGMSAQATTLTSPQQKLSYTLGAGLGKNLQRQKIKLDVNSFEQGMSDAYQGKQLQLSPSEMQTIIKTFRQQQIAKIKKVQKSMASKSKQSGDSFLEKNKNKPGVKTLADGLQYKILTPGSGAKPKQDSVVTVNYKGMLVDGTVFDSSYKRGKPTTFPVNGVIKGWKEAIPMMKQGATWMLYVPSDLAYGARGIPGVIPANSTLIFKVNLISFK